MAVNWGSVVSDWLQWTGPVLEPVTCDIFTRSLYGGCFYWNCCACKLNFYVMIYKATSTNLFFFWSQLEILILLQKLSRWPPCLVYRYLRIVIARKKKAKNKKNRNSRARVVEEEKELKLVPLVDLQFCCPGSSIDNRPKWWLELRMLIS